MPCEKSWSGMRKYLEQEMLAPSLRGRVRYHCGAPLEGEAGLFAVYVDDRLIRRYSMDGMASSLYRGEKPTDMDAFWRGYWHAIEQVPAWERDAHDELEFAAALRRYRELEIALSLTEPDPNVRMLALLDRRVGKRTLTRLREEVRRWPGWLQEIYDLRAGAEGLPTLNITRQEDAACATSTC